MNDQKLNHSNGGGQNQHDPHQEQPFHQNADLTASFPNSGPDGRSPDPIQGKVRRGVGAGLKGGYDFVSLVGHFGLLFFEKVSFFAMGGAERRFKLLRIGLASLLVFFVGASILYFMMGHRAMPAGFLKEQIKMALADSFGGADVKIDQVLLQRDTLNGGLYVRLTDMVLREKSGGVIAASPDTAIGLKFFPLLIGSVAPDSLSLIGPEVHLMRDKEGNWNFRRSVGTGVVKGLEGDEAAAGGVDKLSAESLAQLGEFVEAGLKSAHQQLQQSKNLSFIGVRQARIVLYDRETSEPLNNNETWLLPSFTLQYDLADERRLVGSGILQPQDTESSEVWFSLSHGQGDQYIDVKSRLQNIIPTQLVRFMPALSSLTSVKLGISGSFEGRVDLKEGLHSGQLQVLLSEGEIGIFGSEGPQFAITRGAFDFTMEAGAKQIVMKQGALTFPTGEVALNGDIWRESRASGPGDWRFQLYSTRGEIYADQYLAKGLNIDEFSFAGRLFAAKIPVSIDEMRVQIGQASLLLAHDASHGFPAILRGRFDNIDMPLLKTIWPADFMKDNRDWVVQRVQKGVVRNGQFALKAQSDENKFIRVADVGRFQKSEKPPVLPSIDYEIRDLAYTIFDDPALIETPRVRISIRGDKMNGFMKKGRFSPRDVGVIEISEGRLSVANIHQNVPKGRYHFNIRGPVKTALALIEKEPFGHKTSLDDKLEELQGTVQGKLQVDTPLKEEVAPDEVVVAGTLQLVDGAARFENFKFKNAQIKFTLERNSIAAKGGLLVNGASVTAAWRRQLKTEKFYEPPPLVLRGVFDEADRNQLGLYVNDMVRGAVPVEVLISEADAGADEFDVRVNADLTKARLSANTLGWEKAAGRSASLTFSVKPGDRGKTVLKDFEIAGVDLTARGQIVLNKDLAVEKFSFPQVSYKIVSNISLNGERNLKAAKGQRIWVVRAKGKVFDGRGMLRSLLQTGQISSSKGSPIDQSDGVELKADFTKVLGWHQAQINNFQFTMKRRGDQLKAFRLRGNLSRRGNLSGKMVSERGDDPTIRLNTDNAGEALRLIGFYPNMLGGQGQLQVRYNVKKRQLASQTGRLLINRFSIASDPVVQEVLANISKGKKGSKLSGESHIPFNRLDAPFSIGYRQFVLHDSYVKGDLLGATMRGQLDFQKNQVRLSGTYVPLYGLNAAVGAVPVLGDILVGREGEGMLGITFGIYGDINRPEVLVNPMSLVAPGVFRQIFEFEQKSPTIKVRPNNQIEGSVKRDSSASKVRRLKKGESLDLKPDP